MEAHSDPAQRWRLTVGRTADAPRLTQRETTAAWEATMIASGLPLVPVPGTVPVRPRLQFGVALPAGIAAEAEWLDVILAERLPRWRVREALEPVVPEGWRLVDLEDVWLAGPALGGLVVGADYRVTLAGVTDAAAVADACSALLAASELPRQREKGGALVAYDLRPLLVDAAIAEPGPPIVLRIRTRIHPSLGSGRPDEVVAAMASVAALAPATSPDAPLAASSTTRERLLLAGGADLT